MAAADAEAEFEMEREPLDHDEWFAEGEEQFVEERSAAADAELNALSPNDRVLRFRAMSRAILQAHRAEDLIPASGKIVVFDHDLPVKYAFFGLLEHNINCAPVWDTNRSDWAGMLTVTDFIDILLFYYHQDQWATVANALGEQCIRQWAAIKASMQTSIPHLLSISPDGTLWEALETVQRNHIHRLPVLQKIPENTILSMLTHLRILNFLLVKFKLAHEMALLRKITVADMQIGTFTQLHTVQYDTKLIAALELLTEHKISAVPVVNDDGVLMDVFSRSDVLALVIDKNNLTLETDIKQALAAQTKARQIPICSQTDSLFTVFKRLIQARKIRTVVVDPETKKAIGTISLSDVFKFLLGADTKSTETSA